MKNLLVPTLTAIALGVAALASARGASAAPASTSGIERPASGLDQVRMRRHHRMMRHRMMRHRMTRRRAPSQAGNSRDPSRPMRQQNQGQTTGGPRY